MTLEPCPVELYQKPFELEKMIDLYRQVQPKHVLEIGSMFGGTLYYFIKYADPGAMIASVDLPVPPGDPRRKVVDHSRSLWPVWAKGCGVSLLATQGKSQDPQVIGRVAKWLHGSIDFLFIDGGHLYQEARTDLEIYGSMVGHGGVIALHDIIGGLHPEYGVHRLWSEVRTTYPSAMEYVENKKQGECGIGIIWR